MKASAFEEREMFDALMQHFPDTIYFKDTEGRFVSVNQKQAEILGAESPDEVVGKTDFDFSLKNKRFKRTRMNNGLSKTANQYGIRKKK